MDFTNPLVYGVPCFLALILLELTYSRSHDHSHQHKNLYNIKDLKASLFMGIGSTIIAPLIKTISAIVIFTFIYETFNPLVAGVRTNIMGWESFGYAWYVWIGCQLLDDFTYYWFHRISHESRFFWASHVVHHSSQKYNLSTALRQTWSGGFYTFVFWLWMPLIGFHPNMILLQMSISLLYQFWIHTETIDKMPTWFEAVFNTPSHHRVHHGSNPIYLDRNHAGILIIWDKLFGTFQPELDDEKVIYGLTENIKTYNPIIIAFHEWVALFVDSFTGKKSIGNRIKYLFKPPGWKHDGTGKDSEILRKEWLNEHSK